MVVDRLDRVEPVTSVRARGGAFRSNLWLEVMASTLDTPVHLVGAADGSALAAGALGSWLSAWPPSSPRPWNGSPTPTFHRRCAGSPTLRW